MHTYPSYHAPTGADVVRFVLEHPFAIVATSVPGKAPIATHLPVVAPPDLEVTDTFVGTTLWSHMGRANRHWRVMEHHREVLLVHSSSHGYVSPSLYPPGPSAPTLDYAAVHLTGTVRLMDDEESMEVVMQTVRQLEAPRGAEWDMSGSLDYFRDIIAGTRSFAIEITGEQAMFKLSQDKTADTRQRVHDEFATPGEATTGLRGCPHADIAGLMEALPEEHERRGHVPPLTDRGEA